MKWERYRYEKINELQNLEEINNEIFIKNFELSGILNPEVSKEDITLLFSKAGEELGIDIKSVVESEELKLVDALTRHPQYLREAVEGRPFFEVYEACKEWTPDALLSDLLTITREKA